MTAFERLAVRLAEAEACMAAMGENQHGRLLLAARAAALRDAIADIEREWAESEDAEEAEPAETEQPAAEAASPVPQPGGADPSLSVTRVAPSAPDAASGQSSAQPAAAPEAAEAAPATALLTPARADLPGRPVAAGSLYYVAKQAGLGRRTSSDDASPLVSAETRHPFAEVPADELAEAREMMRKASCGAKALHEYFGWPLERAQAIAAAIRDEQAAERAA